MTRELLKNSAILSVGRFGSKFLGLISTLIVARILAPEDYGIIAAAMIFQDFANRFQNIGFNQNIITSESVERKFIDTIFYTKFILSFLVCLVLFLSADTISNWLKVPESGSVIKLISWILVIQSCSNLNLILQERDKKFKPTVVISIIAKFLTILLTISLAVLLGNYWALAISMLLSSMLTVLLSYTVVTPYIPKLFCKEELTNIASFSKWIFFRQMSEFLNNKIPHFTLARYFPGDMLGLFTMTGSLANMLVQEVSASVDKANLSQLSRKLDTMVGTEERKRQITDNFVRIFRIKNLLTIPAYIFCVFYGELVISVLLGEKWIGAATIFSLLCIRAIFLSYRLSVLSILMSLRNTKAGFSISAFSMFIHLGFAVLAFVLDDGMLLVYGTIISNICCAILSVYLFKWFTGFFPFEALKDAFIFLSAITIVGLICSIVIEEVWLSVIAFICLTVLVLFGFKKFGGYVELDQVLSMIKTRLRQKRRQPR